MSTVCTVVPAFLCSQHMKFDLGPFYFDPISYSIWSPGASMSRQIKLFIDFISERPKILCADAISKFCSAAAPFIMVCPSFVNLCERVLALKQLRAYILYTHYAVQCEVFNGIVPVLTYLTTSLTFSLSPLFLCIAKLFRTYSLISRVFCIYPTISRQARRLIITDLKERRDTSRL